MTAKLLQQSEDNVTFGDAFQSRAAHYTKAEYQVTVDCIWAHAKMMSC